MKRSHRESAPFTPRALAWFTRPEQSGWFREGPWSERCASRALGAVAAYGSARFQRRVARAQLDPASAEAADTYALVGVAEEEFASAGYEAASTNRIVAQLAGTRAHCSKGALFTYFDDKPALFAGLVAGALYMLDDLWLQRREDLRLCIGARAAPALFAGLTGLAYSWRDGHERSAALLAVVNDPRLDVKHPELERALATARAVELLGAAYTRDSLVPRDPRALFEVVRQVPAQIAYALALPTDHHASDGQEARAAAIEHLLQTLLYGPPRPSAGVERALREMLRVAVERED